MESDQTRQIPATGRRLVSLDALRGFDMFCIIGGMTVVRRIAKLIAGDARAGWYDVLEHQLHHVKWHGFVFYDLIFPLFVFVVGVAIPFSLCKRVERGEVTWQVYFKVFRRAVLLVLLGMIYQGLLEKGFSSDLRCTSVLGRIGVAYFFAALITLNTTSFRARGLWVAALLLGYWAAMTWIPVPGVGAGVLEPGKTLADYVDQQLLPGRLFKGNRDPEGLLSTVPAVATCLLGVLAGAWLRRSQPNDYGKAAGLATAGAACLAAGWLWSLTFPFNKNLWTSSFVLWAGGWSLLLLAAFYLIIDVWQWRKWSFFFVVIGMNAITIYMARRFVDFSALGKLAFDRAPVPQEILVPTAALTLEWLLLYVLWRSRIFLRL
ncbi:MAG: DUF5009 domain-containing protein [Pirellulales bacterium]|nr:DUF5009 domain-containing protein [Pirellulales bacterium]